jgi:hypothetical protein
MPPIGDTDGGEEMPDFLNAMSFAQMAWIPVIVYVLHYAEEGPLLVEWLNRYYPIRNILYTQKKLNLENILYFAFTLAGAVLLNLYPGVLLFQAMVFSVACAFVGNTWFHAKPTLTMSLYSPGVVSSCLFNQVACFLLFQKAWSTGICTIPFIALTLLLGVGVFPLVVYVTHNVLLKDEQRWPWLDWFPLSRRTPGDKQ